jgi:DNA-binding CsgD family transcriptional regulator
MVTSDEILIGRDAEEAALAGLLAGVADGRSAALTLHGEPGIGKTALLELAIARAGGFRVLRARGIEPEAEIAFSGLHELIRPVVALLDELPERQRAVLAGALALGSPVIGDPLAVRAATLTMLAAAAEREPLLVVVDDAHWLDPSSSEALAFAARRLDCEGICMLLAIRDGEPSAFDPTGLPELNVGALAADAARTLLAGAGGTEVDPGVVEQLVLVAAGNPLALLELPSALSAGQLAGREPLQEPLPVGIGVQRAFAGRFARLPRESRDALLIAAASGHGDHGAVASALHVRGLGEEALVPAERAGLIAVADGRITFHHPLVRSVVYERAAGEDRRAAHAALAVASDETADRRAWHRAAAAIGPDERIAAALQEAADVAAARGGLPTAARTYQRAADLSVNVDARASRLLSAAHYALASGRLAWTAELVAEGLPLAEVVSRRADFVQLAAAVERERGSVLESRTMLWDGAAATAAVDPTRATLMLIDATCVDTMSGDLTAAAHSGRRAQEFAADAGCMEVVRQLARATQGWVANRRGELTADQVEIEAARDGVASAPELPPGSVIATELLWGGWYAQQVETPQPRVGNALDRAIVAARERGALTILPYFLGQGAQLDYRDGRWRSASARAAEAVELATSSGQVGERAWGLVSLMLVEAAQGSEADCRAHAAEAEELAIASSAGALMLQLRAALGLLELGLGRIAAAVAQLDRCADEAHAAGHDHPNVLRFEPDHVEALVASGRQREARAAAERLLDAAERVRSPFGLATAARCQGLLADENEYAQRFQSAVALHDRVTSPFERARTELCYGERLRRVRRVVDAREQLMAALAGFDQLGARPWAQRARRELAAAGAPVSVPPPSVGAATLTPQELRVALVIGEGATVREAATQLFLSPKTIEAHLGRAYRKLGVRNRAQLVTALARREP